jgi:hypothetical protein
MADLDSFFAKKDKKKVKGKKFTTTEEIARRLNDTEKKVASATKSEISKKLEESEDGLSTSKVTAVPELDDAEVSSAEKIAEVDDKKVVSFCS